MAVFGTIVVILLLNSIYQNEVKSNETYLSSPPFNLSQGQWELTTKEKKCADDPMTDSRCGCDPDCARYGDCCPDSIYFKPEEQKLGASYATCHTDLSHHFYVFSRCPSGWNNSAIRHQCEHPDPSYPKPMFDTLITSLRTNVTYRSSYCASCHDDLHQDMMYIWPLGVNCYFDTRVLRNFDSSDYFKHMRYDKNSTQWYFNLSGQEAESDTASCASCKISLFAEGDNYSYTVNCPSPRARYFANGTKALCKIGQKEGVMSSENRLRYCKNDISACAAGWGDTTERELCEGYTSRVAACSVVYRNYHCAICNYVGTRPSACVTAGIGVRGHVFSLLLDWRNVEQCGEAEVFDPLSNECQRIALHQRETVIQSGSCTNTSFTKRHYILETNNYTVFVPDLNRTYYQHEYVIQDGLLILCLSVKPEKTFVPELSYITIVGLSLSITCIVLHLTVLCLVPKLINLPALNLASLCVSLLLLYSSFIASGFMTPGTTSCVVVAVTVHYSLLASFLWMLIISFDIFNMTRRTNSKLVASKGMNLKRFALYSTSAWITPLLITGSIVLLDHINPDSSFAPRYGAGRCWLNHSKALLLFCLIPLVFVMCFNVVFFLWTSYLIRQMTHFTRASTARKNFSLNLRLFMIMGLTWITGIIAATINVEGLWYLFVMFNTMQGVFIFLAFTCSKNVRQNL